jgi:hypothetical protein
MLYWDTKLSYSNRLIFLNDPCPCTFLHIFLSVFLTPIPFQNVVRLYTYGSYLNTCIFYIWFAWHCIRFIVNQQRHNKFLQLIILFLKFHYVCCVALCFSNVTKWKQKHARWRGQDVDKENQDLPWTREHCRMANISTATIIMVPQRYDVAEFRALIYEQLIVTPVTPSSPVHFRFLVWF